MKLAAVATTAVHTLGTCAEVRSHLFILMDLCINGT